MKNIELFDISIEEFDNLNDRHIHFLKSTIKKRKNLGGVQKKSVCTKYE